MSRLLLASVLISLSQPVAASQERAAWLESAGIEPNRGVSPQVQLEMEAPPVIGAVAVAFTGGVVGAIAGAWVGGRLGQCVELSCQETAVGFIAGWVLGVAAGAHVANDARGSFVGVLVASAASAGLGLLVIDSTTGSAGMYLSVALVQVVAVVVTEMATGVN